MQGVWVVSWNDDIDVGDCIRVYSNESAGHYVIEPDDRKSSHEALLRSTEWDEVQPARWWVYLLLDSAVNGGSIGHVVATHEVNLNDYIFWSILLWTAAAALDT